MPPTPMPPPEPAPNLPPIDPRLQTAMVAMVEVMTRKFQAQFAAPPARRYRGPARDDELAY